MHHPPDARGAGPAFEAVREGSIPSSGSMNWFEETFYAANVTGVTSIKAELWTGSRAIAYWIKPVGAGQKFWEQLEKLAARFPRDPCPAPTFYIFEE